MLQEHTGIAGAAAASSKVILLVEDDADNAQVISEISVQMTPHRVFVANTQGALKFVNLIHPDLLLLDYYLPEMTGIALYDYIHANCEMAAIPAVILSAAFEQCKADLERRHLPGLSKPLNATDLVSLIDAILS